MNLPRNTPLKRTEMKKKRSKPRSGRVKGDALAELRQQCFRRDGWKCRNCGCRVMDRISHHFGNSAHMAHIKVKGMGGDSLENVRTLCGACHRIEHSYGPSGVKPCPRKEVA